ncbi:hypothetical protein [Acidiplasma sp.]|uniref:hypothetical protein n=1 Tax=Acidiplasma sp. TaxID=1872114 RepID=UPI002583DCA9|nr:hypothetical protein [Acidiplasma sp.]
MDYELLQKAQEYYRSKIIEWDKDPAGFENHIKREGIQNLTTEFNRDKGNLSLDFNDVCRFLKDYEEMQQDNTILRALSVFNDLINPDADVINIIIAATLKACYPTSRKIEEYIKKAIPIAIIGGVIAAVFLFGRKK